MSWLSLSLIALIVSLVLTLLFIDQPRVWPRVRFLSLVSFQVGGVIFAALLLVTLAQLATVPGQSSGHANLTLLGQALRNSLLLLGGATAWGLLTGLGLAFLLTWARRRLGLLSLLAALLWVIPTFLLAIMAQELQAFIYNTTNLALSGGYAHINPLLVFWAAVILGIRPGAYVYRRARVVFGEGTHQDYVRTALAKGLGWREVVLRHILRPSLPIVVTAWLISLRLMVGSLPLVEFFFGYPGLGQLFVTSFGIGGGAINADMAIACVVVLAALFLLLEAVGAMVQQLADPRLREIRSRGDVAA